MVEALVSAAKSPCSLVQYPFLETGRERLKIITFKKGISTQKKSLINAIFTVTFALIGWALHQE